MKGSIAGPFANAVDGRREDRQAIHYADDDVGGCQAEVVMKVAGALAGGKPSRQFLAVEARRFGGETTGRVGEGPALRASFDGGLAQIHEQVNRGAAGVLAARFDLPDAALARVANGFAQHRYVGFVVEGVGHLFEARFGEAGAPQQTRPELILDVQGAGGSEKEERNVAWREADLLDGFDRCVDVFDDGAAHHENLHLLTNRAAMLPVENQL